MTASRGTQLDTTIQIEEIYNELANINKTKRKKNWRNPFSPRLCKIIIVVFTTFETARSYGTFTDGLPTKFNYENVLDASYLFFTQLRTVFGAAWFGLELFSFSLNQLADLLHTNIAACLLPLILIIHFITKVGIYHFTL